MSTIQDVVFSIGPVATKDPRYVHANFTMPCALGICNGKMNFTGRNVGFVSARVFTSYGTSSPDVFNRPEISFQGFCSECGNVVQLTNARLQELSDLASTWASNFLANEAKAVAL